MEIIAYFGATKKRTGYDAHFLLSRGYFILVNWQCYLACLLVRRTYVQVVAGFYIRKLFQ